MKMKANIEIKFLKIGDAEVTQEVIDRETGLYASTNKTILVMANSLKEFFEKRRLNVEITANVQRDLTSNIIIEVISVLERKVPSMFERELLKDTLKKYFSKDIEKICRQFQKYFKKKKILIETKSTIS